MTKLNSTQSTVLKVDCCRNRQRSRLLPYTFNFVDDTFNFVADTFNFVADVVDFVANVVDFVADVVNFVADVVDFVADVVDFVANVVDYVANVVDYVASVNVAKVTRSTFHKVDCVEFNFVASVYRGFTHLIRQLSQVCSSRRLSQCTCHKQFTDVSCMYDNDFYQILNVT